MIHRARVSGAHLGRTTKRRKVAASMASRAVASTGPGQGRTGVEDRSWEMADGDADTGEERGERGGAAMLDSGWGWMLDA
jgi:hypothetical protein